jgi:hypothetical protein
MRRPIPWLLIGLTLGFLIAERTPQAPPAPTVLEWTRPEPRGATALPAALRRNGELEFGYVERDR